MSTMKNRNSSNMTQLYKLKDGLDSRKWNPSNPSSKTEGDRMSFLRNGGLGRYYYEKLSENVDKILQVDIVNNKTESRGSIRGRGLKLASRMKALGITENDVVVINSNRNANQSVVLLATLFLGAILAPLDIDLCYNEALRLIKKLKPRIIFVELRGCSQMVRVLDDINHKAIIVDLNNSKQPTHIAFNEMFYQKDDVEMEPLYIDDPHKKTALIFSTQGTTGHIALVRWSQVNVYVQTLILGVTIELPGKLLSLFPFCWFLQVVLVCASFEHMVTMIISGAFTEKTLCKYVQDFSISTLILSTDQAMRLFTSAFIKDYNMTGLKTVLIGTTHIKTQQWLRLRSVLPEVLFLTCYGLTETGVVAATDSKSYAEWLGKPGAVGKMTYNAKVKIVDLNTRHVLGANNVGEIYYKGDGLMLGYYKNNEKTQSTMEKGYFKTGDIGMYDDDGWLYFQGRKEDQITFSGYGKFLFTELEDVILSHAKVKNVAVIGNEKELFVLYVEVPNKDLSPATLQEFISEQFQDRPLPTKIIKLNELPTTTLGHIKREVLRKTYLERKLKYVDSLADINDIPA